MADGIDGPRKAYGTDLSDAQWAIMEPLLPAAKPGGRPRAGWGFIGSHSQIS